jgi:archaellum biogenesis protein FlaJ (TadC family)
VLTEKTTKDIKPGEEMLPWRRTYGPALSGRLFDQGVFIGSITLILVLLAFSALGFQQFIDLTIRPLSLSFYVPFTLGVAGVVMNFLVGEIDRKKLRKSFTPDREYKALFFLSLGIIVLSVILGGVMNPKVVVSTASRIPYIAVGVTVLALVSFVFLKVKTSGPVPTDGKTEPVIV